jgi:hypothetical protein
VIAAAPEASVVVAELEPHALAAALAAGSYVAATSAIER